MGVGGGFADALQFLYFFVVVDVKCSAPEIQRSMSNSTLLNRPDYVLEYF